MKYNIRKNWITSFELLTKKPVVMMPFIIIAFMELLALELMFFSSRFPLSAMAGPIVRKFFGEIFLHYPGNLLLLPKIFYYKQLAIYTFAGTFLTAISVNIIINLRANHTIRLKTILKKASKRYISFVLYGIIGVIFVFLLQKADTSIFVRIISYAAKYLPQISPKIWHAFNILVIFLVNIFIQTILLLVIPVMVIEERKFMSSILRSLYLGFRSYFTILSVILLPLLVYLPVTITKSFSSVLVDRTFPEINVLVIILGVVLAMFVDCFVTICVTQFLLDTKEKAA